MKYIKLIGIVTILVLLLIPAVTAQRVQWSGNGHYYEAVLVPNGITWDDAKSAAEQMGGHLVTISSSDEDQFVYSLVSGDDRFWTMREWGSGIGPWIGLYRLKDTSDWKWVTGESVSYTQWEGGEPNDNMGGESQVVLAGAGPSAPARTLKGPNWDDIQQSKSTSYIVEWDSYTPNNQPKTITNTIMTPTSEELAKWISLYENAPDAPGTISSASDQQKDSPAGNYKGDPFSLLPYLQYNADERDQGNCGDCWQWAGTAVMEIQLDYKKNIKDRLSVEYINSNIESSGDDRPCCGGWLDYLAKFYTDRGQAIPWTNSNADWKDGSCDCGRSIVSLDSTSTSSAYPIVSIRTEKVPTHGVGKDTAISNIKTVLNRGKAVWFAFFLPNQDEWDKFDNFWNNQPEDAVYQIDSADGTSYEKGGGHAVVIVGYDDSDPNNRYWIVLNSWGTANGLRPNGLFRVNMDMNYDCQYPGFDRDYALFFETLDVTYADQGKPYSKTIPVIKNPEVRTLEGHSDVVESVAFSPDGRTLASGSVDKTIKLWDVASGSEIRTLEGHSDIVESVAFSPDGRTLASGSYDTTIKLWDVASGNEIRTLKGHSDPVYSVAFSPDGRTLASGCRDSTIKLWDAESGNEIRTLNGRATEVLSVAFSSDGRTLASGESQGTIKLWDVANGAQIRTLEGHPEWVNSVTFSPDGRTLASGSTDNTIKLWDVASGNEIRTLNGHTSTVSSVAFSPDGRTLASGSEDNTIKLWDVASGNEIRTLKGHSNEVLSVAFSPDGRTLASGSYDSTIKLWDVSQV